MNEVFGNLWDRGGILVITTNGYVKNNRRAVMGRGCAKEATTIFPNLPVELGKKLHIYGNHVHWFPEYKLFTFPVKNAWWEQADLTLIERSANELVGGTRLYCSKEPVYLPRPGCGNGHLEWRDVKKVLEPILTSSRFNIITHSAEL